MGQLKNTLDTLKPFPKKTSAFYYSLPALEEAGLSISRLPVSIRVMLESLLRNCDGKKVKEEDLFRLAKREKGEAPFVVSRVLLQDFTGVPLLVDLAAMRDAVAASGHNAALIEPNVPVDLVVDHSVQVDRSGSPSAFSFNLDLEFYRNQERYRFLKWGEGSFETFKVVPPGIGICHQVNLEHLASIVMEKKVGDKTLFYLDTLVGTDSHTTMINGLGVVGWGVGGIEAESAMLGQPVTLEIPDVIGVYLTGALAPGVTATDLTLCITELLRKEHVVGKFVEFFGEGAASLTVADRATIANMAPEYGATMGYFPVDEKTIDYLRMTGRKEEHIALVVEYLQLQKLFGIPGKGSIDYTKVVDFDLSKVEPCVSGPKRPQDRINISDLKQKIQELLQNPISSGGYGKSDLKQRVHVASTGNFSHPGPDSGGSEQLSPKATWSEAEMVTNRPFTVPEEDEHLGKSHHPGLLSHGSIVIAAITSCTNTSNPSVMLAAGLLAEKAVKRGLKINPLVKTSLAPGSRVVTEYLEKAGLQTYLDKLGFQLTAYGCTTCIGNSGPLDEKIEKAIVSEDLIVASVLSGNRNFEARIHAAVKANFLMSPPLVIAFALAGRIDIDLTKEALGVDLNGKNVFLDEIWPTQEEIEKAMQASITPAMFKKRYAHILDDNPSWKEIEVRNDPQYAWDESSTYIKKPPYLDEFSLKLSPIPSLKKMRCLAIFGDSVTTDHISPAGAFGPSSVTGKYLLSLGVKEEDFNSYGSRRGNHEVMMRGTFANVRIKNRMAAPKEGGFTKIQPEGRLESIFDASEAYLKQGTPLIVFAGKDYGMGSSRDWAAKGAALLGVRVVVAESFERIHRSNLIGMGVLPLEFTQGESANQFDGTELFSIEEKEFHPGQTVQLKVEKEGQSRTVELRVRIDTPIEADYYRHGGIMPYVLRQLLS